MTDPRADTIRADADTRLRAAIIEHFPDGYDQVDLGHDLPLRREALAILDGLLADAAEANKRWDEAVEALMRCCKCAVEAKAEARVAALEQERDEAKLGHCRCTAAYAEAREVGDAALARVAALETALRKFANPSSLVLFASEIVDIARAALAAPAPAQGQDEDFSSDSAPFEAEPNYDAQVGLDGPFEMETPAADTDTA